MTREDTLRLLAFLKGCYPNAKIEDPAAMAAAWEMCFAEFDAGLIYKAARLHIQNNRFFPTPADIHANINRARFMFDDLQPQAIEGQAVKTIPAYTGGVEAIIKDLFPNA